MKAVGTLGLIILWSSFTVHIAWRTIHWHWTLAHLDFNQVSAVEVDGKRFEQPKEIAAIVKALNGSEYYSVNHGGWGDESHIAINLKSGGTILFKAGYHFQQHGAVLECTSLDQRFVCGDAFNSALPAVLNELHAPLSLCDTAHGRPCQ